MTSIPGSDSPTQAVEDFFRWKPRTLEADVSHTKSNKSREPGFWDRHMDDELILKKIKFLPSLKDSFLKIAEDALYSAKQLPVINGVKFPTSANIAGAYARAPPIREEADISREYAQTTGYFCAVVAATLELGLSDWDNGFLQWTISQSKRQNSAIADGFLRLIPQLDRTTALEPSDELEALKSQIKDIAVRFPELAIWEFKSLRVVGDNSSLMDEIVNLSTLYGNDNDKVVFPWVGCAAGEACWHTGGHRSARGGCYRSGARTGPDVRPALLGIDLTRTRRRASPPQGSKLTKSHTETVMYLVQQTWAEAVRSDATFLVIHSGNYEIVGFRHRATQTLYLSDVIEGPRQDRYAQFQIGMFIAIMREAQRRAESLSIAIPRLWTKYYDGEPDPDAVQRPIKQQQLEQQKLQLNTLGEAFYRPVLIFNVTPRTTTTAPFLVDTPYYRSDHAIPLEFKNTPRAQLPVINISVHAQNVHKYSPMISTGELRADNGKYNPHISVMQGVPCTFPATTIIKCALKDDDLARLKHEAHVYDVLEERGILGVPEPVGYFHTNETVEFPRAVLLLSHCGEPANIAALTMSQRKAFMTILRSIHGTGYLHGNLQANKLLVADDETVTIIGFGRAQRQSSLPNGFEREQSKEIDQLKSILGLKPNIPLTPARLDLVRMGPFRIHDKEYLDLRDIFQSATSWLLPVSYMAINQVSELTLSDGEGEEPRYIIVKFTSQYEVDRFILYWTSVPIPEMFQPIHVDVIRTEEVAV